MHFNEYFLVGLCKGDTEILLHKVFFDIIYYTGRCGKEGLRSLMKSSFQIKVASDGVEYIEMTYNEKTKKNQGETTSACVDSLHNNHNIISAQRGELCPVKTFKRYLELLHKDVGSFFQYPNDNKTSFTAKVISKNTLGGLMAEISKKAKLQKLHKSHSSQNHCNSNEKKWFQPPGNCKRNRTQEFRLTKALPISTNPRGERMLHSCTPFIWSQKCQNGNFHTCPKGN